MAEISDSEWEDASRSLDDLAVEEGPVLLSNGSTPSDMIAQAASRARMFETDQLPAGLEQRSVARTRRALWMCIGSILFCVAVIAFYAWSTRPKSLQEQMEEQGLAADQQVQPTQLQKQKCEAWGVEQQVCRVTHEKMAAIRANKSQYATAILIEGRVSGSVKLCDGRLLLSAPKANVLRFPSSCLMRPEVLAGGVAVAWWDNAGSYTSTYYEDGLQADIESVQGEDEADVTLGGKPRTQ